MTTIKIKGRDYSFPGVKLYEDRHGKPRCYYRPTNAKLLIPAEVGYRKFKDDYTAAVGGRKAKPVHQRKPRAETSLQGTVEKAVLDYIQSDAFKALAEDTRNQRRSRLKVWSAMPGVGGSPISMLRTEDIERGLEKRKAHPPAANAWMTTVRALLDYCIAARCYGIKKNVTAGVKRLRFETVGFVPWTEAAVAAFVVKFPKGTPEYLGKEMLLALGQRAGDAVRFGWHMITDDGMIEFTQRKTRKKMRLPVPTSLMEVLPPRSNVVGLDGKPVPFLLTSRGKPFSRKNFSQRMQRAWAEVGFPELATHGARKLAARRLRIAGCPMPLIMAYTGHASEAQLRVYLGDVEREEMADGLRAWM